MATEHEDPDLSVEAASEAANEEAMGALHGTVARVLTKAVAEMPTPQYLGAAIAFLKNNNITASPSKNKDLAGLKDSLAQRRQRKELNGKSIKDAQEAFERMQGESGLPLQ